VKETSPWEPVDGLLNVQCPAISIDVRPAQSKKLGASHAGTDGGSESALEDSDPPRSSGRQAITPAVAGTLE
jgi:hypothetical protein